MTPAGRRVEMAHEKLQQGAVKLALMLGRKRLSRAVLVEVVEQVEYARKELQEVIGVKREDERG
jgi:hypothetical protein